MVYADLHVHTTRSDGTLAPGRVGEAAREAGLGAVAVTDHERLPRGGNPIETRDGVTLIQGVELRVETPFGRVDLLGYAVEETPELRAELDRIQENRIERAREIVLAIEDRLGVSLSVPIEAGVGRPDIARAVAGHPDLDYTFSGVFDELIGEDCPCYVARDVPDFETGVRLLDLSCALVALAHPLRYPDPEAALSLLPELDAVEYDYPYANNPSLEPVAAAIEEHGVLATGGSDAHGETLGEAGLSREAFTPVASALDLPLP